MNSFISKMKDDRLSIVKSGCGHYHHIASFYQIG